MTCTANAGIVATTGGLSVYNIMDNSSTATWTIDCTGAATWVNTLSFAESAGTSVGLANAVESDRGGQDGSVQIGLDGPCSADTTVFFTMSDNGMLAQPGTGDMSLQLPWNPGTDLPPSSGTPTPQPYYTFQGSGVSLDWPDSHPGLDSIVYEAQIPAGQTQVTLDLHMVTPYFAVVPDYSNGILATITAFSAPGAIPMTAGWGDPVTGLLWAGQSAPAAKVYTVSPHVTNNKEMPASTMATEAYLMQDFTKMPTVVIGMDAGMAESQAEHDNLMALLAPLGGRIVGVRIATLTVGSIYPFCSYGVTLSNAGWAAWATNKLPTGTGSLWLAATSGLLDEGSTERVGLSAVDDDEFGNFDLYWQAAPQGDEGLQIDPTLWYEVTVTNMGTVVGKPVTGIDGMQNVSGPTTPIYKAQYHPGEISNIQVLFDGIGPTDNSIVFVDVVAFTMDKYGNTTNVNAWTYRAVFSAH